MGQGNHRQISNSENEKKIPLPEPRAYQWFIQTK